jgi:DNA-binding LacI/PurR family transcriptional regulator
MAQQAVKFLNLLASGKKKSPIQIMMPPELIVRDSCAALV